VSAEKTENIRFRFVQFWSTTANLHKLFLSAKKSGLFQS